MAETTERSVLWRRLDRPGHEAGRLTRAGAAWHLSGGSAFAEAGEACALAYEIACDSAWHTVSSGVSGFVGQRAIEVSVRADAKRCWRVNDVAQPQVEGCTDLDLNFSPSTNLLPIRRLGLRVGEEAAVRAAWLRFPAFVLEPLEQVYRRLSERIYRYESAGGAFTAELEVDAFGFVTRYPGLFQEEA